LNFFRLPRFILHKKHFHSFISTLENHKKPEKSLTAFKKFVKILSSQIIKSVLNADFINPLTEFSQIFTLNSVKVLQP